LIFHSRGENTMEVNGCHQLSVVTNILILSSFVCNRIKELIQVWNNMRLSR